MKNYTLFLLLIIFSSCGFSQRNINRKSLNITGKITDETGTAIKSVSITVKGRSNGISTSAEGIYSLKNVSDGDSIRFTHIAYQPVIVAVRGNNLLNVEMKQAIFRLWDFKITDTAQKATINKQLEENKKYYFEKVEIMPSFTGGKNSLFEYFKKTIKYPEEAKKKNIEGEVIVGFIVGTEGEIKNVKMVTGISPECDQIAFNAIKNMPDWVCGIQNGRKVEVYVELSVSFSLITSN